MECLLWVQRMVYVPCQTVEYHMQSHVIITGVLWSHQSAHGLWPCQHPHIMYLGIHACKEKKFIVVFYLFEINRSVDLLLQSNYCSKILNIDTPELTHGDKAWGNFVRSKSGPSSVPDIRMLYIWSHFAGLDSNASYVLLKVYINLLEVKALCTIFNTNSQCQELVPNSLFTKFHIKS